MKQIADGIAMLELQMESSGRQIVIHPTVVWDDNNVILIDAGYPGMTPLISRAFEQMSVPFDRLNKVIVTHQDFDHIGGLPQLLMTEGIGPVQVYAHALEKPYIEGHKPLMKWDPARGTPPTVRVDTSLADGDQIGGLTVIFTPGHTPGHISLYHAKSKTLVTGDATVSNDGEMLGPNESFTPDLPLALQSLARFADFDIVRAICYHGGLCQDNVNGQFAKLAKRAK